MIKLFFAGVFWLSFSSLAVEQKIQGLIDIRYVTTDGIDSYLIGGYGKFRFNDGNSVSVAQTAVSYQLSTGNFSAHVIANGYLDGVKDAIGLSEYYIQYKSLPNESGYRFKSRLGFIYPKISMTNVVTGWASPYTLSYDTINSWLAEELRHQGLDFTLTKLGRTSKSEHDFSINIAAFQANDPAGAVLAWHGWTMSSRQTLRQENQALPNSHIGFVPEDSNVFLELDDHIGIHINTQWTWHNRSKLLIGYYDNRADPKVVENVQWAWRTKFFHLGWKISLPREVEVITQYVKGDTLMQTTSGEKDLVNNKYDSFFIMVSKKLEQHRLTARVEKFSVDDNDTISFDNNNEKGDAMTINYTYQLNKHTFFHSEYNWINSNRPSRISQQQPEDLIERQIQLGMRYFF
ncbi:MAG: hypothetical protein MJK12_11475 [Colwellia sp.]|nr:hypothetical protein [Colwellia sp.]